MTSNGCTMVAIEKRGARRLRRPLPGPHLNWRRDVEQGTTLPPVEANLTGRQRRDEAWLRIEAAARLTQAIDPDRAHEANIALLCGAVTLLRRAGAYLEVA